MEGCISDSPADTAFLHLSLIERILRRFVIIERSACAPRTR